MCFKIAALFASIDLRSPRDAILTPDTDERKATPLRREKGDDIIRWKKAAIMSTNYIYDKFADSVTGFQNLRQLQRSRTMSSRKSNGSIDSTVDDDTTTPCHLCVFVHG